jgi:predicted nucleotidyltransferase component of viral defense system
MCGLPCLCMLYSQMSTSMLQYTEKPGLEPHFAVEHILYKKIYLMYSTVSGHSYYDNIKCNQVTKKTWTNAMFWSYMNIRYLCEKDTPSSDVDTK